MGALRSSGWALAACWSCKNAEQACLTRWCVGAAGAVDSSLLDMGVSEVPTMPALFDWSAIFSSPFEEARAPVPSFPPAVVTPCQRMAPLEEVLRPQPGSVMTAHACMHAALGRRIIQAAVPHL